MSFGNDENMPYRTCCSWKKSYYPCKHFFAVFLKFPNWSWDALSSLYVNSPYLQPDIYSKEIECSAAEDLSSESPNAENIEKHGDHSDEALQREEEQEVGKEERGNNLADLPPTKSWNLSLPSQCRSSAARDKKAFFLLEDNHETISELYETLLNVRKKFQSVARKKNGIILEPTGKNSDIKRKIPKRNLPDAKRRKKPWTGRVGLKKVIQEKAAKVKIGSTEKLSKYSTIESTAELEIQEDDINRENEIDEERKGYKTFVKNTELPVTNEDLEDITNKRMLSHNVINGFNILCRREFEHAAGFQDPLLGQTSQYSVMKNQKFLQILDNNRAHWVVISTYNCKNPEVNYYDSLFSGRINDFVKQQICALMEADMDVLKINVLPVQQQTNSVDCGISAIAFLTCILFYEDPKTQRFDEKLLRESLLQMLAEQYIRCFPTTENNVVKCKSKSISLELCCSCRQPWFSKDAIVENKQMANAARVGNGFIECANVSLERSFRMKVLNGIASAVHLT